VGQTPAGPHFHEDQAAPVQGYEINLTAPAAKTPGDNTQAMLG
jgi:hypothetical protein